jgi:hypothetical protein
MFIAVLALGPGAGCAHILDVVDDACESALGGSKIGEACPDILDKLRSRTEGSEEE